MENFVCPPIKPFKPTNDSCGPAVKGNVKTVYIDAESYKKVGMMEAATNDGRSIIIDNSIPDISNVVPKSTVSIINPYPDEDFWKKEIQKEKEEAAARAAQKAAIENSLGISPETKKLIAAEYMRLQGLHPNWKPSKLARKAGEKYSVKFEFHD